MHTKLDNILSYETSLEKLIIGVNKVCEVVKPTYGAAGGNVFIEESMPPLHRIANDGKLITDAIYLSDPIEQMGVNILKEVCNKQEKEAGDGRKTTSILTTAILNEGLKYKGKFTPLSIKKSLDDCLPIIIESIDQQKKDISPMEVHSVATIASESLELGKIIGEAYERVGKDGILEIEASSLPETFYEVVEGVRVRSGWLGGYWQTEEDKCVVKNSKILISKDKITSVDQLAPMYKELSSSGINELVIFCEDIDFAVASRLAITSNQGSFKTLIVKAPILWKDWVYEDLQWITGGKAVDSKIGNTFKNIKISDLGTCEKWITTKDETRVIGIKDVTEHTNHLRELGQKDNQQLVRAAWLNTKVAILKVGANSESELSWKIRKAKDAINASYSALRDGTVMGAGKSFTMAKLPDTIGGKILTYALTQPYNVLCENNGGEVETEGVIDPAIVVKSAITNAVSVAGIILTVKGAITIPQEIKDLMLKMQQRMPQ